MLNSKAENHKNARKSWQSLFKSQLYRAKTICSQYLLPVVKIIAKSRPSETRGFSHWQKTKQEPCELCEAHHTDTGDYALALLQKLFIFITASKKQDKMLISWVTIIWPTVQTMWVTHLNWHLRLAVLTIYFGSAQQEMKLKWNWLKTIIDYSALDHHLSWNLTVT